MGALSKIEWTDATWNVVLGCDRVSPGCDHCYAIRTAHRLAGNPNHLIHDAYEGLVEERDGRLDWTGRVNLVPERLDLPLRWRRPRRIFVNAQADLFHADVPDEFIAQVFAVMALAPQHTFQVLTKRHRPVVQLEPDGTVVDPREYQPMYGTWLMARVGKRAAGRTLDGRTHDEYPAEVSS